MAFTRARPCFTRPLHAGGQAVMIGTITYRLFYIAAAMTKDLSRRDFLGLAGLAAAGAGLSCIGGVTGYWLLGRSAGRSRSASLTPTASPSTRLKIIDRPPIITRAGWSARAPNHQAANEKGVYSQDNVEGWRIYEGDLRAIYRTVVVHHSVVYKTDDPTTMREIQDLHMDDREWADIGYHFGVGRSGSVFEGRDLSVRGTHVEHYNTGSVGVVFLGNFEEELPAPEQIEQGRRLIDWLALRLELTHLAGHKEFNEFSECPGRYMVPYLDILAGSAGLQHGIQGYVPPPEQLATPTPTP